MFKEFTKLRTFDVKFISTNYAKRNSEAAGITKKSDYYKNLGDAEENIDGKPREWNDALPYESIPGPKPLPLIGNIFRFLPFIGEYYNLPIREMYESFKTKYGNVVSLTGVGRPPIIFLFDVQDMEKHLRGAGAFPIRRGLGSLTHYRTVTRRDVFKDVPGLMSVQGIEWFKIRSVVNPVLMQPKAAQQYIGSMDKVANELIENIRFFSKQNENSEMPEDFQNELYKWALESIGVIALNKHLGCLDLNASKDSEPQKLISSVNEMFLLMYKLDILPSIWKYIETPSWKRFVKVLDFITETLSKHIDEVFTKTISDDVPEDQLNILQKLTKQDRHIAFVMVMDMLTAGIDTTGKTMAAALYFLAKNPDKQQCLREEVYNNLPEKNSSVTKEILNNSPYLKAVIKETTRIAPIAVGNVRTTIKDSVLGGYKIPKGTELISMHIVTANSKHFKDHEKFMPERWLRTEDSDYSYKNVHPFAYQPFGFGPRSCIGKRFANLELEIGISKIIRNFELSWAHDDMVFSGNFLYGVERPLKIRVKEL
ncbi:cytochrome P450 CYP12A2 [Anoplophora glabripennis]|nr:cytochrome P450 CYP12A2 [Anoplophora glabripennis]XP_018572396.1 cytochrome P450 CYP12A2 [Anoplophora glabripennis]XP_018572397.1 cytochrome P450 CYP12A2 [Anoplophora glabripennis]XP_018572399.1 cytochrome P450 CYP12A2 [Anoplophora glabripennis]